MEGELTWIAVIGSALVALIGGFATIRASKPSGEAAYLAAATTFGNQIMAELRTEMLALREEVGRLRTLNDALTKRLAESDDREADCQRRLAVLELAEKERLEREFIAGLTEEPPGYTAANYHPIILNPPAKPARAPKRPKAKP